MENLDVSIYISFMISTGLELPADLLSIVGRFSLSLDLCLFLSLSLDLYLFLSLSLSIYISFMISTGLELPADLLSICR